MLVRELRAPGRGSMTMISSHVLQLCLHLWRSVVSDESGSEDALRGDGPRLVGNFLQLVELHYRDGWPVSRYAAALGVTEDKLHAHCKREKARSPRAIVHERLIHEACTRLQQLDLPVEQIGYGLGFRDPGYFSRFFRKHPAIPPAPTGAAPGSSRREAARSMRHGHSGPRTSTSSVLVNRKLNGIRHKKPDRRQKPRFFRGIHRCAAPGGRSRNNPRARYRGFSQSGAVGV